MTDWEEMKKEYIEGDTSYKKLAERYGVAYSTLGAVAKKEGWVELKKQSLAEQRSLPAEETVGNAAQANDEMHENTAAYANDETHENTTACKDGAEVHEEEIEVHEDGTEAAEGEMIGIANKLLSRLSDLVDDSDLDAHGVKQIASILKDLRDIRESPLETAIQRARLRKLERESVLMDEGAQEITVVFKAGSEEWNE